MESSPAVDPASSDASAGGGPGQGPKQLPPVKGIVRGITLPTASAVRDFCIYKHYLFSQYVLGLSNSVGKNCFWLIIFICSIIYEY
jgi:hypothetical protein